jgi:putative hydrolase of the HAD superfamily
MKPPLRAIFLDAGGTLIHLDAAFLVTTLTEQGFPCDLPTFERADLAARRAVINWLASGEPLEEQARWRVYATSLLQHLSCSPAQAAALRAAVGVRHQAALLWSRTAEGTADALARLRAAGYTLGVVSNADGRVATFLAHAGLLEAVDFVVDSACVGCEKPDPRIFAIACERAGVSPAEAAHVGDVYEVDVLGARRAGITPVLIDPDDLLPDADCARIRSLVELPAWAGAGGAP